jgi:cytochrome c oxidase subunit I+III
MFVGGSLAMLMRVQLFAPEMSFLMANKFNQAITMHGLIMVLWAVSPLAFAFANYIVPLQIGARDLAFPRLNAMSYWLYLFSGIVAVTGFFLPGGAADAGWTLYAPLSTSIYSPQPGLTLGALGLLMLAASVTLGTINFIVTIARMRAPGLTWYRLPMFTWGILFTVLLMLFAFPPLIAAVLLLGIDRIFATTFFSSVSGGALLWEHMFWFFGHPEVYVILTPALGIIGDVIPTFTRRPLFGKKYIIWSLIAATIISFIVYIHHMFTTGINPIIREIFSVTTEIISVPFGIITLAFIVTLYRGRIRFTTPMLFALASIFEFIIGGATGVFLSSVALDHHFRGTYWVVAHFHYQLVGVALLGLFAGIYYWYPKITGRMYNERLGKIHFVISFISINLLYFPMFFLYDMPRRIYTYPAEAGWGFLNHLVSIGGWGFGFVQILLLWNMLSSLRNGEPAGNNPWGAWSLEWVVSSPPPPHNFDVIPDVSSGSVMFTNGLEDVHHEEKHTPLPMILSLGTGLVFIGLFTSLILTILGLLVFIGGLLYWFRDDLYDKFVLPEPSIGERWPFEAVNKEKLGMWVLVASETILFTSFIGAYLFIRSRTLEWIPSYIVHDVRIGAINTTILLTSSLFMAVALAYVKRGDLSGLKMSLVGAFVSGLLFLVIKGFEWGELASEGFVLESGLEASIYYVTTGAHAAHVIAGLLGILYLIIKAYKGRFSSDKYIAVENVGIYWHFVDIVWVFLFPLFYLI